MEKLEVELNPGQYNSLIRAMGKLRLTDQNFPSTSEALMQAAAYTENVWRDWLAGDLEIDPIGAIKKPVNPSRISFLKERRNLAVVLRSASKQIDEIQHGKAPVDYDMKTTHPYGLKSRITKSGKNKGVPYLIVNFRWGTANKNNEKRAHFNNFIPQEFLKTSVKALDLMHITGEKHPEENFRHENIMRNEYANSKGKKKWSYLKESDAWEVQKPNGKSFSSKGLVHMKGGQYFTFRIISAKSPANSWLYHRDGVEAVNMTGAIAKHVSEKASEMIRAGLKIDIANYISGSVNN